MNTFISGILRSYPLILELSCFICYLITNNIELLYIGLGLFINSRINNILKYIILKPIFGNYIFGLLGKRPDNAKNCGYFINYNENTVNTYGMPSGHAQSVTFFLSYIINKYLNSNFSSMFKLISIIIFSIITICVMYSRIYFNCHTVLQVVIGGLIGLYLGNLYYNFIFSVSTSSFL